MAKTPAEYQGFPLTGLPLQFLEQQFQVEDDGPITIDILPPAQAEDQWVIESVSFTVRLANAPVDDRWKPPVSGIYLVPKDAPIETAQLAAFDLNLRPRVIPIPLDPHLGFRTIPSAAPGAFCVGAIGFVGQVGFQTSVAGGWAIRGIFVLNPGAAASGPGAGSSVRLAANVRILRG